MTITQAELEAAIREVVPGALRRTTLRANVIHMHITTAIPTSRCYGEPVRLAPGETIVVGRKIYGNCADCGKLIRANKPVLGSLHLCAS